MKQETITAAVCGCGKTIQDYKPIYDFTVGVNAISQFMHPDFLLILDKIAAFDKVKLNHIIDTKCNRVFTFLPEWMWVFQNITIIKLAHHRGDVERIDFDCMPFSVDTPFTAVCLAWLLGAKDITIYGADYYNHPAFKEEHKINLLLERWSLLKSRLSDKGCKLYVSSPHSALSQIMPLR